MVNSDPLRVDSGGQLMCHDFTVVDFSGLRNDPGLCKQFCGFLFDIERLLVIIGGACPSFNRFVV